MDTINDSAWGNHDPGAEAPGAVRPAGGDIGHLPRTSGDQSRAARQEPARPDRKDGI